MRQARQFSLVASRRGLLAVVCLCYAAVGLSVIPVASIATDDFHADSRQVGMIMGVFAVTALLSRIAMGVVLQRWGYRYSLAFSAGVLVISSLVCAVALDTLFLWMGRLLLGVGVGAMMAVSTAWMVNLPSPRSSVGHSLGSIGTVNYTVLAVAAPLSSVIDRVGGHRVALVVAAVFPLLAGGLLPFLSEPHVLPQEDSSRAESSVRRVLSASLIPGAALMVSGCGYAAIVFFGVQLTHARQVGNPGLLVCVFGATMVLCRVCAGTRMDTWARPPIVAAIFCVQSLGLVCVALSHSFVGMMCGAVIIGAAMAFIYPLLGVQVAARAGADRVPALSLFGASINLGIGLASSLIGLLAHWVGMSTALIVAAFVVAGGGGLVGILKK